VEELVDVDDLRINADLDEKGWWNILLLGSDSRDMNNYYGLTDTIIILSIHPADGTAKLTSVMRDTWVDIYGIGQRKINSANVYGGPELIMRTVNEHFGMNISNYVLVGMEALTDIIDMIGGVTFDITKAEMDMINRQLTYDAEDFKLNDATPLTEYGERVTVTGNQALAYVRIRALDSDYVRTERQRAVLMAIANSLQESDMRTLASAIAVLATYVQTNLSLTQMVALATTGLSIDLANVEELRLPADGTFVSDTYDGVWSIRPNYEKNQAILHEFIYGAPGTTDADAVTAN
ncbi:MAG: LCP family protein, partial [Christensenellales bacterium]